MEAYVFARIQVLRSVAPLSAQTSPRPLTAGNRTVKVTHPCLGYYLVSRFSNHVRNRFASVVWPPFVTRRHFGALLMRSSHPSLRRVDSDALGDGQRSPTRDHSLTFLAFVAYFRYIRQRHTLRLRGDRMAATMFETWLQRLGYLEEPSILHQHGHSIPESHPYALEIRSLLRPQGAIRARAVFDVEGVPTVVFVGRDDTTLSGPELDQIRQKVWNQNLAAVVIEVSEHVATAYPAIRLNNSEEQLLFQHARPDGPFSALDIASANVATRRPEWFDINERVDRRLLKNLSLTVKNLTRSGFQHVNDDVRHRYAELLMGQVLFVSYLEHRNIVGSTYRKRRCVERLHNLIASTDHDGITELIKNLRQDFNGDFLGDDSLNPWNFLSDKGYTLIDDFLSYTDIETGQASFWNYDFSYIPVELLSGLYESLLSSKERSQHSAYYTPRHLAMLAIDHAFEGLQDPYSKTIFDGACGSGILLTTAFRRLIALLQARQETVLSLKDRIQVLKDRILEQISV